MLIIIDPHIGIPVYRQVVDQIRFQIASGRLRPGDELPSTRALSSRLGVNPMTISKAYGILEDEGVVSHRPGLPLVVREQTPGRTIAAKLEQLANVLQPATLAAAQLGIPAEKAGSLFKKLVDERGKTMGKSE